MGISGLLPLLKTIHRTADLRKYAGETLGIDGYGWLHRGAIACAIELAQGKPTRKYVEFAMHRVRLFKHFGVTPYLVFDGDYLPSKAGTEASREARREASRKAGLELLAAGKPSQAYQELQKAIDVTPEMARDLIEELKKAQVPYVVAPYEADAQLVYLERRGLINAIVSEDSDLLVFGAKRLLTKMDKNGECVEINRKDFCSVREISLTGWTDAEFRHMAILSGCDYLDSIGGMGLKTAYRLIRKHKTPERVIKMLQFEGKSKVPDNYLADFKQAELTFLYQRVFCPEKQELVHLTEPDPSIDVDNMPFIGAAVQPRLAQSIARGNVNPITKKPIATPSSPSKRRISQVSAPVNEAKNPFGKPINEYFKGRRIPLGEMDPNAFAVSPSPADSATQIEPRRTVSLPRPYLDSPQASSSTNRPYTDRARRQTVQVADLLGHGQGASHNRRHTAGPIVQVFQDSMSPARPPKKARLCEDLPTADISCESGEHSKFFSAPVSKKRSSKRADELIMSDDSIDEIFQSIPDPSSRRVSVNSSRDSAVIQIFDELPTKEDAEQIAFAAEVSPDVVEVPESPPVARSTQEVTRRTVSHTPISARLQKFSYSSSSAARQTRMAHGLPTPSSSSEKPSNFASTPRSRQPTPKATPFQRTGARALQQTRTWATPSAAPSSSAKKGSRGLGAYFVNPASVPLPKVDLAEVAALSGAGGSEDQIVPASDEENDEVDSDSGRGAGGREAVTLKERLDLSQFLYA
ncbi:Exodeoxyribonuclease 1 [Podospora conica]|nr:Exodeoxyribonuclease 1 [Schizothecium conicum]